jgi:hypothetical protein
MSTDDDQSSTLRLAEVPCVEDSTDFKTEPKWELNTDLSDFSAETVFEKKHCSNNKDMEMEVEKRAGLLGARYDPPKEGESIQEQFDRRNNNRKRLKFAEKRPMVNEFEIEKQCRAVGTRYEPPIPNETLMQSMTRRQNNRRRLKFAMKKLSDNGEWCKLDYVEGHEQEQKMGQNQDVEIEESEEIVGAQYDAPRYDPPIPNETRIQSMTRRHNNRRRLRFAMKKLTDDGESKTKVGKVQEQNLLQNQDIEVEIEKRAGMVGARYDPPVPGRVHNHADNEWIMIGNMPRSLMLYSLWVATPWPAY